MSNPQGWGGPWSQAHPPQHEQRDAGSQHTPRRAKLWVAGSIALMVVAVATGIPVALSSRDDGPYKPPEDGTGYSIADMDQPSPLNINDDPCIWAQGALRDLAYLGVSTVGEQSTRGCSFPIDGTGVTIRVRNDGTYSAMRSPTNYITSESVAGLDGRAYQLVQPSGRPSTGCTYQMDTRSIASMSVDVYSKGSEGSVEQNCSRARRAAATLARRFVPLAGGHPVPALQAPMPSAVERREACNVVNPMLMRYTDLPQAPGEQSETPEGSRCQYRYDETADAKASVLVTNGKGGLSSLPPADDAKEVRYTNLGGMPARTARTSNACAASVQYPNGQVVQLDLKMPSRPESCPAAMVVQAETARVAMEHPLAEEFNDRFTPPPRSPFDPPGMCSYMGQLLADRGFGPGQPDSVRAPGSETCHSAQQSPPAYLDFPAPKDKDRATMSFDTRSGIDVAMRASQPDKVHRGDVNGRRAYLVNDSLSEDTTSPMCTVMLDISRTSHVSIQMSLSPVTMFNQEKGTKRACDAAIAYAERVEPRLPRSR